jgi:hypothetical protein
VVTPNPDDALCGALRVFKREGFELLVVWLRQPGSETRPGAVPEGVPIYAISNPADLRELGARRL